METLGDNKMKLIKAIFENRAPFEHLELDFGSTNIFVLSGINGTGKTTFLSYVVDAFYELAKVAYAYEFKGKETTFYRIASPMDIMDFEKSSIVFFRFYHEGMFYDYLDVRNGCSEDKLKQLVGDESELDIKQIFKKMEKDDTVKVWSISDRKRIESIFSSSLLTYFPAYRYEQPSFLSDAYKIDLEFKKTPFFNGYLNNPIEVTSDLNSIANWLMDIVLDSQLYGGENEQILLQISSILSIILKAKTGCDCRIGVGPRGFGAARIQVVKYKDKKAIGTQYPSIFSMSAGELSLLCLFSELIKQADRNGKLSSTIDGIVLVDEIDKHLHMVMQKEILPKLIRLFPDVQFIVSSHSPFFNLGLEDVFQDQFKIFNMDNSGIECSPEDNDVFRDVYSSMIQVNDRYVDKYHKVLEKLNSNSKPLIITEGKTDWRHIKAAMKKLGYNSINVEFLDDDNALGDKQLEKLLKDLARVKSTRKIIGIFDRDNSEYVQRFGEKGIIELLPNTVWGLMIPAKNQDIYGPLISLEHYYKPIDLKKENRDGRRLFIGSEFHESGVSKDGIYETRTSQISNKVKINGIIDEKVYLRTDLKFENSVAMSKADFAELIYSEDSEFTKDIDYSSFKELLDIIKKLCTDDG